MLSSVERRMCESIGKDDDGDAGVVMVDVVVVVDGGPGWTGNGLKPGCPILLLRKDVAAAKGIRCCCWCCKGSLA